MIVANCSRMVLNKKEIAITGRRKVSPPSWPEIEIERDGPPIDSCRISRRRFDNSRLIGTIVTKVWSAVQDVMELWFATQLFLGWSTCWWRWWVMISASNLWTEWPTWVEFLMGKIMLLLWLRILQVKLDVIGACSHGANITQTSITIAKGCGVET